MCAGTPNTPNTPCLGLIPQRGQQGEGFWDESQEENDISNMCPLPPEHEATSQINDFSLHYMPTNCSTFVYSHSHHKTTETWGKPVSEQLGLGTSSHHQIDTSPHTKPPNEKFLPTFFFFAYNNVQNSLSSGFITEK